MVPSRRFRLMATRCFHRSFGVQSVIFPVRMLRAISAVLALLEAAASAATATASPLARPFTILVLHTVVSGRTAVSRLRGLP